MKVLAYTKAVTIVRNSPTHSSVPKSPLTPPFTAVVGFDYHSTNTTKYTTTSNY